MSEEYELSLAIEKLLVDKTNNSSQGGGEKADAKCGVMFKGLFVVPTITTAISEYIKQRLNTKYIS